MAEYRIPRPGQQIQLGNFLAGDYRFPAVYFLHLRGEIVYVGQSKTLRWRIEAHLEKGSKLFDAVSFAACPVSRLLQVEGYYIRKHVPRYNKCGVAIATRRDSRGGQFGSAFADAYLSEQRHKDADALALANVAEINPKSLLRHRNRAKRNGTMI